MDKAETKPSEAEEPAGIRANGQQRWMIRRYDAQKRIVRGRGKSLLN